MKHILVLLSICFFCPLSGKAVNYDELHNQLLRLKADISLINALATGLKTATSLSARRAASACQHWNTAVILSVLKNDLDLDTQGLDYCKLTEILQLGYAALDEFFNDIQNAQRKWLTFTEQNLAFYEADEGFRSKPHYYIWESESGRIRSADNLDHLRWYQLLIRHMANYNTLEQPAKVMVKNMLTYIIDIHMQISQIYKLPVVFYTSEQFQTLVQGLTGPKLVETLTSLQEALAALQEDNKVVAEEKGKLHFEQVASILYQAAYLKTGENTLTIGNQTVDAAQILLIFLQSSPNKWIPRICAARDRGDLISINAFNTLCFDYEGNGQFLSPSAMLESYFSSAQKDWLNDNQTHYVLASRLGLALVFEYLSHHLKLEDR